MIIWNILLTLAVIALAWVVWHLWQFMAGIESQDDHEENQIKVENIKAKAHACEVIDKPCKWPCNVEEITEEELFKRHNDIKTKLRESDWPCNDDSQRGATITEIDKDWVFKTEDRVDDK